MSVDISVSITEDIVDIIATPTVNIVNVTNSASIDPGLYDLSEFTNTSGNPFVRTSGLSSYVPTSRTLTINGLAQDLSTDRSWTISTGLTVGTTPIASGTIGRVLFEGTGNVLQESANLFWDNTNARLGIGTSSPTTGLNVTNGFNFTVTPLNTMLQNVANNYVSHNRIASSGTFGYDIRTNGNQNSFYRYNTGTGNTEIGSNSYGIEFYGTNAIRAFMTAGGNFLINTTTDAGFRLDVNGTSRITGLAYQTGYAYSVNRLQFNQGVSTTNVGYINGISNGVIRLNNAAENDFTRLQFGGGTTAYPSLQRSGSALAVMDATGTALSNLLIGTTTDAGFRLDVNGTARVSGNFTAPLLWAGSNATTLIYSDDAAASQNGISLIRSNRTGLGNQAVVNFIYQTTEVARFTTSGILAINTTTPNASSIVDITSTTRGFLPPRMTTTQKNAIASPAAGLQVFDTTLNMMSYYNGTIWVSI
jgi:hypothetical protein